jgi:hypothetical protein
MKRVDFKWDCECGAVRHAFAFIGDFGWIKPDSFCPQCFAKPDDMQAQRFQVSEVEYLVIWDEVEI